MHSFLRGLKLLELLDHENGLSITELARRLSVDKATASRLVAAAETDGWLARDGRKIELGPRSALLGLRSATTEAARRAEGLVHATSGATGFITQALALAGGRAVALTGAPGRRPLPAPIPAGLNTGLPLWAGAGSKVIAAQMSRDALDAALPDGALPNPRLAMANYDNVSGFLPPSAADNNSGSTTVADRAELDEQIRRIRIDGSFHEVGELLPNVACLSVPWTTPGLIAALVCIGPTQEIANLKDSTLSCLRAAARPGSTGADILSAAQAAQNEEPPLA